MPFFAVRTRVDLDYAKMMGYTEPGGSVWRFVDNILQETAETARLIAPERTGALKGSIFAGRPSSAGRSFYAAGRVECRVPYAEYVHEGTVGPIFPTSSRVMHLPPYPAGGYNNWVLARSVSGQRANPFLANALESVLGSLRVASVVG